MGRNNKMVKTVKQGSSKTMTMTMIKVGQVIEKQTNQTNIV